MLKRQNIKEIIVLLLATITLSSNDTVIESVEDNRDKIVLNSFCYASLGEDMEPETKCRWGTPEALMKMHGYMPKRRVQYCGIMWGSMGQSGE